MTNGSDKTNGQPITLERNVDDTFLLTYNVPAGSGTVLFETEEGDIDEAIAYVATFFQVDYMWVQHVTDPNKWVVIGIEE